MAVNHINGPRCPFGYRLNEEGKKEPIPSELKALKLARHFIMNEGKSMGKTREWLVNKTGRQISIRGMCKAINYTPPGEPVKPIKKPKRDKVNIHLTGDTKKHSRSNIFTDKEINEALPEEVKEELLEEKANIVFEPNPGPQTEFLAATEKEVLYGGARGGGKSYSLIVDPLRYCHKKAHRALIIRKTMPELRDMINHAHNLYKQAFPEVKWKEQEKVFTFPSGARIEFGYAENEQDAMRYLGQAYTWIGVDEIGLYATDRILTLLKGSLRSVDPEIPTYIRMTCNPGGAGMHWLKEQFVDAAEWNTTFHIPVEQPDGTIEYISRRFIPSKLSDNPYLTRTADYRNMLLSLPDKLKKMWLEGRWDVVEGAAFEEFDPLIHVIEPFDLPSNWVKFRACDWGFSTNFCVLWMAVDYENTIYVYREWYGKGFTADVFAQRVRLLEQGEYIQYGVMDSSVWARRGDIGPPVPEIMRLNGCLWRPSDRSPGSRKSGKMEVHRRLRIFNDYEGKPTAKLKIFKSCRNLIRTLPSLPLDSNDMEDIDTTSEDHAYDALRYGLMSRPMEPSKLDYYANAYRYENAWRPASKVGY